MQVLYKMHLEEKECLGGVDPASVICRVSRGDLHVQPRMTAAMLDAKINDRVPRTLTPNMQRAPNLWSALLPISADAHEQGTAVGLPVFISDSSVDCEAFRAGAEFILFMQHDTHHWVRPVFSISVNQ